MSIEQAVCRSYKAELLQGVHQPSDTFKMALYTEAAVLNQSTARYAPQGEVVGEGYEAGGKQLYGLIISAADLTIDFDDVEWPVATFTARGALIYNASKGNRAIGVIDFGSNVPCKNGPFSTDFPRPGRGTSLLQFA